MNACDGNTHYYVVQLTLLISFFSVACDRYLIISVSHGTYTVMFVLLRFMEQLHELIGLCSKTNLRGGSSVRPLMQMTK